jgi:energy-coupling factor transporter ATP-binding protein EcfA2
MGRAIVREPQAFLFDEPLSNLDAKLRVQMRAEIRKLHNRLKATSIFVTHDQVEAMTLADLVVVMNAGRIEQIGAPTAGLSPAGDALRRHLHRLACHEPDAGPRRWLRLGRNLRRRHRVRPRAVRCDGRPAGRGRHPPETCIRRPRDGRYLSPKPLWKSWAPPDWCTARRVPRRSWWRSPQRRTMAKRKLGRRRRLGASVRSRQREKLRRDIRGTST